MATYPAIAAGQRITTAMLSALTYDYVIKANPETITSSTTMQNDDELFVPVVAGAQYELDAFIRFSGLQAAGIKVGWTVPSGTSFNVLYGGPGSANAVSTDANTTEMRWAIHGSATAVAMTNPRNSAALHTWTLANMIFTVGATAGNIQLQWAQNVANATGSVVQAQSYIRYRRIG